MTKITGVLYTKDEYNLNVHRTYKSDASDKNEFTLDVLATDAEKIQYLMIEELDANDKEKLFENLKAANSMKLISIYCELDKESMLELFNVIKNCESLEHIAFDSKSFKMEHLDEIVKFINENKKIGGLTLDSCDIDDTKLAIIAEKLKDTSLEFLSLSKNKITGNGIESIKQIISTTNIKKLCIDSNEIADADLAKLPNDKKVTITSEQTGFKAILYKNGAEPIEIFGADKLNDITDEIDAIKISAVRDFGKEKIFNFLKNKNSIKKLILLPWLFNSENNVTLELLHTLNDCKHIEELNLYLVNKKFEKIDEITNFLKNNKTIKAVSLGGFEAVPEFAVELAKALEKNNTIESFDFRGVDIGDDKAKEIAASLATNKSLKKLNFSGCNLTASGAAAIMNAVKNSTTLEKLDLSNNNFSVGEIKDFAKALAENKSIKKLDLSTCHISSKSAIEIINALKNNTTLEVLNLKSNSIGNKAFNDFAEVLRSNQTLKEVDLGGYKNKIKDEKRYNSKTNISKAFMVINPVINIVAIALCALLITSVPLMAALITLFAAACIGAEIYLYKSYKNNVAKDNAHAKLIDDLELIKSRSPEANKKLKENAQQVSSETTPATTQHRGNLDKPKTNDISIKAS